jgi:hypothetical protein
MAAKVTSETTAAARGFVRRDQLVLEKPPISAGRLAVESDARDNATARL